MAENSVINSKLIAIGGSAGSLKPLFQILAYLDSQFPIPVVIILHRDPLGHSRLAEVIAARAPLPVKEIEDKELIEAGNIYVCPADYHLLVETDNSFALDYSEKVQFSRPSIDVSFMSAADAFGQLACFVLLSGANADGALGLKYAKKQGGTTIIQSPDEAEVSYMPQQAILECEPDYVLSGEKIGQLIAKRV